MFACIYICVPHVCMPTEARTMHQTLGIKPRSSQSEELLLSEPSPRNPKCSFYSAFFLYYVPVSFYNSGCPGNYCTAQNIHLLFGSKSVLYHPCRWIGITFPLSLGSIFPVDWLHLVAKLCLNKGFFWITFRSLFYLGTTPKNR